MLHPFIGRHHKNTERLLIRGDCVCRSIDALTHFKEGKVACRLSYRNVLRVLPHLLKGKSSRTLSSDVFTDVQTFAVSIGRVRRNGKVQREILIEARRIASEDTTDIKSKECHWSSNFTMTLLCALLECWLNSLVCIIPAQSPNGA